MVRTRSRTLAGPRGPVLGPTWCWPDGVDVTQRFVEVSADEDHGCARAAGGRVWCWGGNDFGEAAAPDGVFVDVSVWGAVSCGVRADGSLSCWGSDASGVLEVPAGRFSEVFAGSPACALRVDGVLLCWHDHSDGAPARTAVIASAPWVGPLTAAAYAAGNDVACGIRSDATMACWGNFNPEQQRDSPEGAYTALSISSSSALCAVATNAAARCWSTTYSGNPRDWFTPCGRSPKAEDCWGKIIQGHIANRPLSVRRGSYTGVAVGLDHACGIRTDSTVACWGSRYYNAARGYSPTARPPDPWNSLELTPVAVPLALAAMAAWALLKIQSRPRRNAPPHARRDGPVGSFLDGRGLAPPDPRRDSTRDVHRAAAYPPESWRHRL